MLFANSFICYKQDFARTDVEPS